MNELRRPLIAGNWKMNFGGLAARDLAAGVVRATKAMDRVDVVICPPFTALHLAVEQTSGSAVGVGAQNVHAKEKGAFTGEISVPMLRDAGVGWVILGHSERRAMFNETDGSVAEKVRVTLDAGLRPIICVGETLEQRERGETLEVVKQQVNAFASILADKPGVGCIAYEPIWAIGTGKTAGPREAQEVHAMIRQKLAGITRELADKTRILYGGSMKPANARGLLEAPDVDGGLIGGASLDSGQFAQIVEAAQNLAL